MTTAVSGCVHCQRMIFRGDDDRPWQLFLAALGIGDRPDDPVACHGSPDGRHQSPADPGAVA